ncbi:Alstrom syndrome protein 1-like protein [Willisornis vidua]|uniref:Alstrom syndrome protein 1-like protein n=1 Tax=Willisornis vidua TaxID=1566151 RepID=A0ABQ9DND2_9PASS|nr:Alstrom syndrome protein 1-like protein [Willisornis vidua]
MPTSFESDPSTLSISLPPESEVGSDVSPQEVSPTFSRCSGDNPASQWDPQCPTVPNQELPNCSSDADRPLLAARNVEGPAEEESRSLAGSLQGWSAGVLPGVTDGMEAGRGFQATSDVGRRREKGQGTRSVRGSGVLRDIRELLAQAEHLGARWCHPAFSTASCGETGECPPVLLRQEDDPKDSREVRENIPRAQRRLSWDEAATQPSLREEGLGTNPGTCHFRWANPFDANLCHGEGGKETSQEFKAGKSAGRSEPEGCSSVTTDRNPPGVVGTAQSRAGSEDSAGTASELGNPPCPEPLGSITEIPGGFQGMSQSGGAGSRAGGTQGSDGSSSGDSLAARVRNLLEKNPPPSEHPKGGTHGTGGFQSIPWGAAASRSTGAGMGESGSSSSGDSLAARVRSLLRSRSPGIVDTAQILRNAEEQERKIRGEENKR